MKKLGQERKHTFSPGVWNELESRWGREVCEGSSRRHEQHGEEFCTSSANVILDGQRGLWLLSQEAGMSSKEETGAGSQHERREGWATPWSQASSCFTHPVSVLCEYHRSSKEQCQNKMWPYLRCLQMRNKCIVLSRCLVCLTLLMPNNVRI